MLAMGTALEGHDGLFDSGDALVGTIAGLPPRYNSPTVSAAYFHDRTEERLERATKSCLPCRISALSDRRAVLPTDGV